MTSSEPTKIAGVVERVTFHSTESGFAVIRIRVENEPELVTVVGTVSSIHPGEMLSAQGTWVHDREYGRQFKSDFIQLTPPHSLHGIKSYLGSGVIKGVGPSLAERIVNVFGANTAKILDESPARLMDVPGVGAKKLQAIKESWREQASVRELMLFLNGLGVTPARALRIHRVLGAGSVELIRENPFRLADEVHGIGFKTADALAKRLGTPADSPHRIRAAVSYVLQEMTQDGHVGYPEAELCEKTIELAGISSDSLKVVIEGEIEHRRLIREFHEGSDWLFLSTLYRAETTVARAIKRLLGARRRTFGDADDWQRTLEYVEKFQQINLATAQRDAIGQAAHNAVSVVTGGPGVGKTTMVRCLLALFAARGLVAELAAPTGRAAKRLSESSGQPARTIHRLLEFDPGSMSFQRNSNAQLEGDLFVIDESSMLDVVLAASLFQAIPTGATVVLVGDAEQLPSVGPGSVLSDIIQSDVVPTTRLKHVFRQGEGSKIIAAAHDIQQGNMPEPGNKETISDFYFIEADSPEAILDTVTTLIVDRIPKRFGFDPMRDVQVLTPMNRGILGAKNLNQTLQAKLNPPRQQAEVDRFGTIFRVGDKVLQTSNNYQRDVFNGDLGMISRIDPVNQDVFISFDGREIEYDFGDLSELSLAYCLTIHKSQGSEYPCVIMPLHTQHFMLLQRNLVYTGITRGKKLVVVVGSKRALQLAIARQDSRKRYTALAERLRRQS